jgi:ectoine hydroxylase-related dioxygenase (phytanoyl-CoA dioxygenase family)
MVTAEQAHQLDTSGYVILHNYMTPEFLAEARASLDAVYEQEGEQAGTEFRLEQATRRLANLVDKGEIFRRIVSDEHILEFVQHVIPQRFKLSSLNGRAPNPNSDWVQPLHIDSGQLPDAQGNIVCNVIWMLDDFTAENGATRIVPGSHKWGKFPQEVMADLMAPHPQEVILTAPAGTVAVINTHAWHGGTANRSGGQRRCLHAFYTRWDKPQQQWQDAMLSSETKAGLSDHLRQLLAIGDEYNAKVTQADPGRSGFLK